MRKLLVANRSEIATRVFRAATELGLQTVAVYTYEDRFSLHRFKADESYQIGPAGGGEPVRGYLDIENIIAIAKAHDVDAIHPGYGFLSENAHFARACEKNGITFVGPTPKLLETFGDKTSAKRIARQANVPTLPGTEHGLTDPAGWGVAHVGMDGDCKGVSVDWADIGSSHPDGAHLITLTGPNVLHVDPSNTGPAVPANTLLATFSIANWGRFSPKSRNRIV